jgi:hypothetical protein
MSAFCRIWYLEMFIRVYKKNIMTKDRTRLTMLEKNHRVGLELAKPRQRVMNDSKKAIVR